MKIGRFIPEAAIAIVSVSLPMLILVPVLNGRSVKAVRGAWTETLYEGPAPYGLVAAIAALLFLGAILAIWRGHKLTFASTVCLLCFTATLSLWWRSSSGVETIVVDVRSKAAPKDAQASLDFESSCGGVLLCRSDVRKAGTSLSADGPLRLSWRRVSGSRYPARDKERPGDAQRCFAWNWGGFALLKKDQANARIESHFRGAVVPYWCITLPWLLVPGCWLLRLALRFRRRALGLCARCGYDLRGSSSRCPECGTVRKWRICRTRANQTSEGETV